MAGSDLVGTKLGEYEIIEHIGHGVAADVYKAYQPKLGRHVAIKVLSPVFADEVAFRERFVREARAVARLDHPNILPVYDFNQQEKLVYIVMQYVDTGSLEDLVGQPLPLNFTRKILEQVCSALSYAHKHGIVHRDVKPGNILLGPENWALLTDFGLVKILEIPSTLTPSGMSLGTPAYMAPEQVAGDKVDQRADIYALGATLYHMVTGRVPFEGGTGMAVAFKHLSEALIPPRKLNPNLPQAVDRVVVKALAKEPELRYQSIDELLTAFRRALEGAAITVTHTTPVPLVPKKPTPAQPAAPRKAPATPPSPLPPVPLEAIWPPEQAQEPAHAGSAWGLLVAIAGTLAGFSLLLWALATFLENGP